MIGKKVNSLAAFIANNYDFFHGASFEQNYEISSNLIDNDVGVSKLIEHCAAKLYSANVIKDINFKGSDLYFDIPGDGPEVKYARGHFKKRSKYEFFTVSNLKNKFGADLLLFFYSIEVNKVFHARIPVGEWEHRVYKCDSIPFCMDRNSVNGFWMKYIVAVY